MKLNKKAQGIEDWTQAFIVSLGLILVFVFFLVQHENKPYKLEQQTDLVKEQIEADQLLIDYLNTPISKCIQCLSDSGELKEDLSNLFENSDTSKITNADLISLFISGNPEESIYNSIAITSAPDKSIFFSEKGNYGKYLELWNTCANKCADLTIYNSIRIYFTEDSFFASSIDFTGSEISSTSIPTKNKDYPTVEVSIFRAQ